MKTLKLFLLVLSLSAFSTSALAQDQDWDEETEEMEDTQTPEREKKARDPAWDRVFWGGNATANFGNLNSFVYLSPRVGYRITDQFSAGVGLTYMYRSFNARNAFLNAGIGNISTSLYGGNIFGRLNVTEQLFAQTEFEALSVENFDTFDIPDDRALVPSFFVGGGYSFRLGKRSFLNTMVLYNLLYTNTQNNPYSSPIDFRVGIQL